jgi:hypothetical protein
MDLIKIVKDLSHEERYNLLKLLNEKESIVFSESNRPSLKPWEKFVCSKCNSEMSYDYPTYNIHYYCNSCRNKLLSEAKKMNISDTSSDTSSDGDMGFGLFD